ncbi:hypothetical protein D3C87_1615410 [compost metagenome]
MVREKNGPVRAANEALRDVQLAIHVLLTKFRLKGDCPSRQWVEQSNARFAKRAHQPQQAIGILCNGLDIVECKPIAVFGEVCKGFPVEPAEPVLGTEPHKSLPVLKNRIYFAMSQPVGSTEMLHPRHIRLGGSPLGGTPLGGTGEEQKE